MGDYVEGHTLKELVAKLKEKLSLKIKEQESLSNKQVLLQNEIDLLTIEHDEAEKSYEEEQKCLQMF